MMQNLSPNTQAILLLTAPLIAGRGTPSTDLLSPGEYKRLARHLREIQQQPADLVSTDGAALVRACHPVIDELRLQRLLGRGFLLSQVIEHWQSRAIWVLSRADAQYPSRLRHRLREDAPAVIYGCGDIDLLETGGLAVVGSRHVDDSLIEYTMTIGRIAAKAGRAIVSGGAKGVDQAAMRGAIEAGGKVSGILADSLERTAMNRENRNLLLEEQLVLISPYDPSAGFNVGHAMQRNKLIYALSDLALVVGADINKGGTWTGAVEQLERHRFVPVYVRSTGEESVGLKALHSKGASLWPNPQDADALERLFETPIPTNEANEQPTGSLFTAVNTSETATSLKVSTETFQATETLDHSVGHYVSEPIPELTHYPQNEQPLESISVVVNTLSTPAKILFLAATEVIRSLLKVAPMKDVEIADALDVSNAQAKIWLQRLVEEGQLEKQKKPVRYAVKQSNLFD
jgi:DNA processing protein